MTWGTFILRLSFFAIPGVLLLLGGLSEPVRSEEARNMFDLIAQQLHPDSWPALLICSVLICLPGVLFYVGADYLAEMTFARVPLKTTPAIIWHVVAFVVTLALAWYALQRMLSS
jgi:hypothetical protein